MIGRILRFWCWFTGRHAHTAKDEVYRAGGLVWFRCPWCKLMIPSYEEIL